MLYCPEGPEPQFHDDTAPPQPKWPIHRATARALVSAAAETLGHGCNIQLALAAQADPQAAVRKLAKEDGHFNSLIERHNSPGLRNLLFRVATSHLFLCHRDPGQRSFPVQVGKGRAQQPHLGGGMSEVNIAGAMRRIRSGQHQFARQLERYVR